MNYFLKFGGMARIIPRKYWSSFLGFVFFILFSVMLASLYFGMNICMERVGPGYETAGGRVAQIDRAHWKKAEQFNVDDYGIIYILYMKKIIILFALKAFGSREGQNT